MICFHHAHFQSYPLLVASFHAGFPFTFDDIDFPFKINLLKKKKKRCCCLVAQPYLTLSDSMDCSGPGSSVHEIFQARLLEWVAISLLK